MVVYINYGADPVAVLTTCIMACPCSLYLAKLFMPETGKPETAGTTQTHDEKVLEALEKLLQDPVSLVRAEAAIASEACGKKHDLGRFKKPETR